VAALDAIAFEPDWFAVVPHAEENASAVIVTRVTSVIRFRFGRMVCPRSVQT